MACTGSGTGKPYGFARWQVEKRAPGLCSACPLSKACPIQNFPEEQVLFSAPTDQLLAFDPNPQMTAGTIEPIKAFEPEIVLLTVDSLGDADPVTFADDNPVAMTFAPVPSFAKFKNIAELHPFDWLKQPHGGSVKSFSAWRAAK